MNALTEPVRPERGFYLQGEMWTADIRGNRHKDISEYMIDASVTYKWEDDISGVLNCTLSEDNILDALDTTLVPILTVRWKDRTDTWHQVRERLGTFFFLPPPRSFTAVGTTVTIEAYDGVWALNQLTTDDGRTVKPDSADLGDWASTIVYGKTRLPLNFVKTGRRPGKITNWTPNQRVLPIINDFYTRAGYWPVKAMRNGIITSSGPRTLLIAREAERSIRTDQFDIIGDITEEPERDDFANQVFLSSSSATADLSMRDGYKVTNTDPDDRWSLPNMGYVVSKEISDSQDEDFDSMRRRAISILEVAGTMKTRITIPTFPDPRFEPYGIWNLMIQQETGETIAASPWRVEELTIGLTQDSAAQVTTLGKFADLSNVI